MIKRTFFYLSDLDRVSEGEEDINIRGSRSKSKAYTHKEV